MKSFFVAVQLPRRDCTVTPTLNTLVWIPKYFQVKRIFSFETLNEKKTHLLHIFFNKKKKVKKRKVTSGNSGFVVAEVVFFSYVN